MTVEVKRIPLATWQRRGTGGHLQTLTEAVIELQQQAPSCEGGACSGSGEGKDYPSMTAAQAAAGTSTKAMVVSPKVLNGLVTKIVEEKLAELNKP